MPALDQELRSLRAMRRLSLGTAAALADISKSALAAWETGTSRPRGAALARLLKALEADPRTRARLLQAADPAHARVELAHSPLGAPVDVGMILRAMRERRGLTQADLARRVGVTQSAVSRWEAGEIAPPPETLHTVGFALGAKAEETLALTSAQGGEGVGLSDDPAFALRQVQMQRAQETLGALREVVSLGQEAELWRRAARDPRWDVCLIAVLAKRADWLVGQERFDEIASPARRAIAMAKTTEERRQAVPAIAALADLDRHRGAGHAATAEVAAAWTERLPKDEYGSWMLFQRGMCLARMGLGDQSVALIERSSDLNDRALLPTSEEERWIWRTTPLCEARLAAGQAAQASALVGGRRARDFSALTYVRVEHANGRAASDADMAHLRFQVDRWQANSQGRRRLERIERRQARITGGEPMPYAPGPTDDATRDRLWAAVLSENRG